MAKVSPVSIKYMIHANFSAEGALEKPDIIGALFGQTEGLLGADLEMRELQKEGKIGRIEVTVDRKDKMTTGTIQIPTALDQSETTLIAAAIETIERIGPCDSTIDVEKIEDVRGSKRDYILERAKSFMSDFKNATDSRDISNQIKESARMAELKEYGLEKLPYGDLSEKEIFVVEGRADVLNLLRNGITNVIAMNGTKLPEDIKKISNEKDITLFVDGDRGGKLIIQNVVDNANVNKIAIAPEGKEVEELTGKEIIIALRKKISVKEFMRKAEFLKNGDNSKENLSKIVHEESSDKEEFVLDEEKKQKLKQVFNSNKGSNKAILLNKEFSVLKEVSVKGVGIALKKSSEKPFAIVVDGTVTQTIIKSAEESGCKVIAAKNFASTDTKIKLLSF